MNIIIPMAGMGKRMRPHTLTTPKPLLPVAGKPIVQRLVEEIVQTCEDQVNEIAFVIGRNFGEDVEKELIAIAERLGSKGRISYQDEALGTAHAVYCAAELLHGPVIVAFADTLFKGNFKLDRSKDGTIWVHKVEDPRAFGVVKMNEDKVITEFIEKPEVFISDLAIIGIYYFSSGETLEKEIRYLLDHQIKEKGEYQLTSALENMKAKGAKFTAGQVSEWLDCGNKNATVYTNQRILEHHREEVLHRHGVEIENSVIIEPCFIGNGCRIVNSRIGPHVSLGANCTVSESEIHNSIVQDHCTISNARFHNSMLGNHVIYDGTSHQLSISDYSTVCD
jgi:glucose-1-phosphate thymidylyltransferase